MKAAKFGVILFGMGLTMTRGKHLNSEALLALARDMNAYTRFVAKPMRGHGNVTGADNVVAWRTGYPFGVNLSRGYPRFNPGEYTTADTLARGEADAAMIVASDPMANFSQPAREHLAAIPYIALDPKETPTTRGADRGLHHGHLRHQHAGHGLSHGRRADSAAAGVRLAASQRLRRAFELERRVEGTEGRARVEFRASPGRGSRRSSYRRHNRGMANPSMPSSCSKSPAARLRPAATASMARCAISGSRTARSSPRRPIPTVRPDRTLDAAGLVVMPGGIDMHCHIAGPKVNVARKMRPEEKRRRRAGACAPPPRTAARWAACPARSPPATSTPAWATPRPSTPPFRRWPPATCTRSSTTRPASTRAFTSWWATTTTSCGPSRTASPSG